MAFPRLLAPRRPAPLTAALPQQSPAKPSGMTFGRDRPLPWQTDAWRFYDDIGMIKYYGNFRANAFAKVRLFVGVIDPGGGTPIPIDDPDAKIDPRIAALAMKILDDLRDPVEGQSGILRGIGLNEAIVGECRLLGRDDRGPETWEIFSNEELRRGQDNRWELRSDPYSTTPDEILPDGVYVKRLWRPHPRRKALADCAMRGVLKDCAALELLESDIMATAQSRLGAGVLALKKGIDGQHFSPEDRDDEEPSEFVDNLIEHMAAPIRNPGTAAAVIPLVSEFALGTGERLSDVIQLISFDRKMDPVLAAQREEKRKVIAGGLDLPEEVLLGMGASTNHWCVDDQTEILTTRGWIRQHQLAVGDVTLTLNHETGLSEWQPVQDIYRADVVDEPMLHMESRNHSSITTLEHRWPTVQTWCNRNVRGDLVFGGARKFTVSRDLKDADRITTGALCVDTPAESKWLDDFAELMGWFWTEGNIGTGGSVTIAQSHTANPAKVERIRACLTRLYGPARTSMRRLEVPAWRQSVQPNTHSHGGPITVFHLNNLASRPFVEMAPRKIVSLQFIQELTSAQLELFIEASMLGDGHHQNKGYACRDIWQRESAPLDALELAGILAGRTVTRGESDGGYRLNLSPQTQIAPVKAASQVKRGGSGTATAVHEAYTGTVWCPVTANTTWLARRNGTVYYTGNSAWAVDDQTWKGHLEPDVLTMCSQITSGYLRPIVSAELAAGDGALLPAVMDVLDRIVVWYDPAGVVNHPDRGKDALDVYNVFELSGDALRTYKGFAETDKPDPDEVAARVEQQRLIHSRGAEPGVIPSGDVTTEGPVSPATVVKGPPPTPTETAPPKATTASLVASGSSRSLSERFLTLDQRLRARVEAAADTAVRRGMERAGNRIATKVARQPALKATVAGVARGQAAAALGRSVVASLDLTDDDLLDGCFDDLADQTDTWVEDTQRSALTVLVNDLRSHGVQIATVASIIALLKDRWQTPTVALILTGLADSADGRLSATLRDTASQITTDAEAGRTQLLTSLQARARDLLYSPDPLAQPADGEWDGTVLVSAGLVRGALNLYGGGPTVPGGFGDSQELPAPSQAVAAGSRMLGLADAGGYTITAYQWVIGSPEHPFIPHQDLDGAIFEGPDDSRLSASEDAGWLDSATGGYWIGDHRGCQCDCVPLLSYEAGSSDIAQEMDAA